jgi:multicomponent K+:H+ antiporter subunit E
MQSVSFDTLALGLALAIFWPAITSSLRPAPVRARKPLVMLRLFGHVVLEMLRSNVEVGRAILTRSQRNLRSGFVHIPLDLTDPNGLAVLAMIVTFIPGTAWVQLSADRRLLLLHVLEVHDEASIIQSIKRHYELPLMEIFQ